MAAPSAVLTSFLCLLGLIVGPSFCTSAMSITTVSVSYDVAMVVTAATVRLRPKAGELAGQQYVERAVKLHSLRHNILSPTCDYVMNPPLGPASPLHDVLNDTPLEDLRFTGLGDGVVHISHKRTGLYGEPPFPTHSFWKWKIE